MDADDLARGRELVADARAPAHETWWEYDDACSRLAAWAAVHFDDLLDAAARAAAAEAEVRRLGLLARSYVLARLMGDDPLDELRAGLERPEGDGDGDGR